MKRNLLNLPMFSINSPLHSTSMSEIIRTLLYDNVCTYVNPTPRRRRRGFCVDCNRRVLLDDHGGCTICQSQATTLVA